MRYLLIFFTLLLFSCGGSSKSSNGDEETNYTSSSEEEEEDDNTESDEESGYEDGEHEATVNYYNPSTETHSTYDLTVEIEDNYVIQINWPNGGWTDEDHFSRAELDDDGNASFTSDSGYEYDISIND